MGSLIVVTLSVLLVVVCVTGIKQDLFGTETSFAFNLLVMSIGLLLSVAVFLC